MSTPQGSVRMREPGRIRVDSAHSNRLTEVSVFDGEAQVEGAGVRLTVFAGRRAEIGQDDVRTALAVPDGFDNWAMLRDRNDERSEAVRYVSDEMTGYEDLDRHGIWREHREYGSLWLPRGMPVSWAPYRDGRWTFIAPWGWTWVDNAPWGYAPFHYGRWVRVDQRWGWAPGRRMARPIWAPALVGWVGGSNWSLNFSNHGPSLAQGWYPLSPFESYAPSYRLSREHLNYHNYHARPNYRRDWHGHDRRGHGLTVVPQNRFTRQGTVVVPEAPKAVVAPIALQAAPTLAPAAPRIIEQDPRREPHRDLSWRRTNRVAVEPEMRAESRNEPRSEPRTAPRIEARTEPRFDLRDDRRFKPNFEPRSQQVRQVQPVLPAAPPVQQFTPPQRQERPAPMPQPQPMPMAQPQPQPQPQPQISAPQHVEPAAPVRQPRSGQIKERIVEH
jgi:hypothetical protein